MKACHAENIIFSKLKSPVIYLSLRGKKDNPNWLYLPSICISVSFPWYFGWQPSLVWVQAPKLNIAANDKANISCHKEELIKWRFSCKKQNCSLFSFWYSNFCKCMQKLERNLYLLLNFSVQSNQSLAAILKFKARCKILHSVPRFFVYFK